VSKPGAFEADLHASFGTTLREAGAYFAGEGRLHESLYRLASRLRAEGIPFALAGGMALGEHGYVRMTEDVDVLLTATGLARFHERLVGHGYVTVYPGARRTFRDAESGVRIQVRVSMDLPGDGKPQAVRFPDPEAASEMQEGLPVLRLSKLVELKLASGMTAPHRLRDLADVQEIIKARQLDESFATELDASVRATFVSLVEAARTTHD